MEYVVVRFVPRSPEYPDGNSGGARLPEPHIAPISPVIVPPTGREVNCPDGSEIIRPPLSATASGVVESAESSGDVSEPAARPADPEQTRSRLPTEEHGVVARPHFRSPEAVREAMRLRRCPHRLADEVNSELRDAESAGVAGWRAVAARQKPEFYAGVSHCIDNALEGLYGDRDPQGLVSLYDEDDNPIDPQVIDSWEDHRNLWGATVDRQVIRMFEQLPPAERTALSALHNLRMSTAVGTLQDRDFLTHIRGGISAATIGMTTIAYGMGDFLDEQGVAKDSARAIIQKSTSPIMDHTETAASHIDPLLEGYHGVILSGLPNSTSVDIDYDEIDYTLYKFAASGAVAYKQHPASLPWKGHPNKTINDIPENLMGPRIACPIRLSPQQVQRLWTQFIRTACAAELL